MTATYCRKLLSSEQVDCLQSQQQIEVRLSLFLSLSLSLSLLLSLPPLFFITIILILQNVCSLLSVSRSEDIVPKIRAMIQVIETQGNLEKVYKVL